MDTHENSSVLVTGGRGFIGRAAVKLLQRAGYRVVSLDAAPAASFSVTREAMNREEMESGGAVREVLCDIAKADELQGILEKERIDRIVHLAAILPTVAQREPARTTRVNVEGSLNLLEMARRIEVRRMVFGSSLSVYGTCPEDQVVTETDRAAPEDLYGAAKLYVEQLGAAYRKAYGVEFVSLRIGRVVGYGAQSATSAWRSQIFELLETKGAVKITLPYLDSERILLVHVDDVAKMLLALLRAAECPEQTVYNALCESVVVSDLKRELERLNSNINVRLGDALALGNPRRLDSSRFQREFGFQTIPIFEQLRRAAER